MARVEHLDPNFKNDNSLKGCLFGVFIGVLLAGFIACEAIEYGIEKLKPITIGKWKISGDHYVWVNGKYIKFGVTRVKK